MIKTINVPDQTVSNINTTIADFSDIDLLQYECIIYEFNGKLYLDSSKSSSVTLYVGNPNSEYTRILIQQIFLNDTSRYIEFLNYRAVLYNLNKGSGKIANDNGGYWDNDDTNALWSYKYNKTTTNAKEIHLYGKTSGLTISLYGKK